MKPLLRRAMALLLLLPGLSPGPAAAAPPAAQRPPVVLLHGLARSAGSSGAYVTWPLRAHVRRFHSMSGELNLSIRGHRVRRLFGRPDTRVARIGG